MCCEEGNLKDMFAGDVPVGDFLAKGVISVNIDAYKKNKSNQFYHINMIKFYHDRNSKGSVTNRSM